MYSKLIATIKAASIFGSATCVVASGDDHGYRKRPKVSIEEMDTHGDQMISKDGMRRSACSVRGARSICVHSRIRIVAHWARSCATITPAKCAKWTERDMKTCLGYCARPPLIQRRWKI